MGDMATEKVPEVPALASDNMPPSGGPKRTGSGRSVARMSSKQSLAGTASGDIMHGQEVMRKFGKLRRTPKSTSELSENSLGAVTEDHDIHGHELELELHRQLFDSLRDCSRQRLRALRMCLRRYGSPEARISTKELLQVFQENNLKISSRTFQMLVDSYEDPLGVDYEKMWKSFVAAQEKTGRDSVHAQNRRNDLESQQVLTPEEKDADLVRRVAGQLDGRQGQYDLPALRHTFQARDRHKTGKTKRDDTESYLQEYHVPVYGALLKSLLGRCDLEKDGLISWPELMSFLERAHQLVTGESVAKKSPAPPASPRPSTAQSVTSQSGTGTPTAGNSGGSRRGKSATPRNKRQGTAPVLKGRRAASAKAALKEAEGGGGGGGGEGKETAAVPEAGQEGQDKIKTAKSEEKAKNEETQSETEKIPEPIAKDFVKKAFKQVVAGEEDKPGETDPGGDKTSGTGEKKPSAALAKKYLFKKPSTHTAEPDNEEMRKASNSVKTASGFLSSMKSLLKGGGKKKDEKDQTIPLIHVEKNGDTIPEEVEPEQEPKEKTLKSRPTSSKPPSQSSTPPGQATVPPSLRQQTMEADIQGKKQVFHTPDNFDMSTVNTDPPQERLKLEWIYGYRGNDCRSNIYVLKSGELVYFVGNVTILYNRETHHQRHYREHTHDIKCISVHPGGVTVATGQSAGSNNDAHVRMWRSDTLQTLHIVGMGILQKSVITLSFTKAQAAAAATLKKNTNKATAFQFQERLCAVDESPGHALYVWDVASGREVAHTGLELEAVCGVDCNPKDLDIIAVIGKEHLGWWKIYPESESVQLHQKADYQNYLRAKYVICLLHNDRGDLITGDSNGTVYVWGHGGNVITNLIKHGHDGPVFTLLFTRGTLLTGGRDGMIYGWLWGKNMDQSGKIEIPKPEGGVRMLQNHKDRLLIGTTTNSILTATLSGQALRNPLSGVVLDKTALTMGHFDLVTGLCASDDAEHTSLVFTAGHDGILCLYDTVNRQPLWKFYLKGTKITCIDANTSDGFIAIGTRDSIVVLSIDKDEEGQVFLSEVCRKKVVKERLTTIKLAPDCESLAVGDACGGVTVVGLRDAREEEEEADEVWDVLTQWQASGSSITGLDWSLDMYSNTYLIRTSSSSKELAHWNTETGDKVTKGEDTKNITWLTNHCHLGYDVAGIWSTKQAMEAQIQTLDVNMDKTLVAMGDSKGYISLLRYPCAKKGAYSHSYHLHREIPNLVYTKSGSHVITVGGADSTVAQWLVQ